MIEKMHSYDTNKCFEKKTTNNHWYEFGYRVQSVQFTSHSGLSKESDFWSTIKPGEKDLLIHTNIWK